MSFDSCEGRWGGQSSQIRACAWCFAVLKTTPEHGRSERGTPWTRCYETGAVTWSSGARLCSADDEKYIGALTELFEASDCDARFNAGGDVCSSDSWRLLAEICAALAIAEAAERTGATGCRKTD